MIRIAAVLLAVASIGCPSAQLEIIDGEPRPEAEPGPGVTSVPNLTSSPDDAYLFLAPASSVARHAVFLRPDVATTTDAGDAPLPDQLVFWSRGHGYIGAHTTEIEPYGLVSTLVSIDLERRQRVWMRHGEWVEAFGLAAGGERIWVSRRFRSIPDGIELLRSSDGARVARLPRPADGDIRVEGSGVHLVTATRDWLAAYDPLTGTSVCTTALPEHPYQYLRSLEARGTTAIVGRMFGGPIGTPDAPEIDEDVLLVDTRDCSTVATLPGRLHGVFGDFVVWLVDTRYPSHSAPLPAAVDPAVSRWYLAATHLRTRTTSVVALGAATDTESPAFAIAPEPGTAILLPRVRATGRTPLRLADLATGAVTEVPETGDRLPASGTPPHVMVAPDEPVAYIFLETKLVRLALPTGMLSYASMPGGSIAKIERINEQQARVIPGRPWFVLHRFDRIFLVDRETMTIVHDVPSGVPRPPGI